MASRDPNERAVLERAAATASAVIGAIPEGGADGLPPVSQLDDVQVVACGFSLICGDVLAMLKPRCLASLDLPIIVNSAWDVDELGWWLCPVHATSEGGTRG